MNNFNDEIFNPESSYHANVSPARATFEFPISSTNLLGGQIFRKMAEFNDKLSFNFANFAKMHSPLLEEASYLNPLKGCYDLSYINFKPQKSYFASRPISRQESFSNLPMMSKLPGHEEEAIYESIEQMRSSDENVRSTETKSHSTNLFSPNTMKLVNSASLNILSEACKLNEEFQNKGEQTNNFKRLKIPRLSDFQLYPSFTSKLSTNSSNPIKQLDNAVQKSENKELNHSEDAGYE